MKYLNYRCNLEPAREIEQLILDDNVRRVNAVEQLFAVYTSTPGRVIYLAVSTLNNSVWLLRDADMVEEGLFSERIQVGNGAFLNSRINGEL